MDLKEIRNTSTVHLERLRASENAAMETATNFRVP
jgi:hypothetical protein